jgi:hypothetical protein
MAGGFWIYADLRSERGYTNGDPRMAGVIDGFRWAITGHGHAPDLLLLASAIAVALVLLGGLFFFNRMETSIADQV